MPQPMAKSLCAAIVRKPISTGPCNSRGEGNGLQRWPEDIVGDADYAEGDADRHQHLCQFRRTINAPVEEPFERDGDDDGADNGQDHDAKP